LIHEAEVGVKCRWTRGWRLSQALADRLDATPPRVRITELLHEVNLATGFAVAFTNLRTGEAPESRNLLLNVAHPDAERASIASIRPFSFEDRLWRPGDD